VLRLLSWRYLLGLSSLYHFRWAQVLFYQLVDFRCLFFSFWSFIFLNYWIFNFLNWLRIFFWFRMEQISISCLKSEGIFRPYTFLVILANFMLLVLELNNFHKIFEILGINWALWMSIRCWIDFTNFWIGFTLFA